MIKVVNSDNIKILKKIPDKYFHSIVCDPPYHIGFMGKKWDHVSDKNKKIGIAFDIDFWCEILRVLKPGGYLLAFAAAKLDHRIAVAIEDAGFIIRDKLLWMYGSGFPKGQNIAKAIDKKKGLKGKETKTKSKFRGVNADKNLNVLAVSKSKKGDTRELDKDGYRLDVHVELVSDEAKQWAGFNTAIKPAYEPIIMAQKPLTEKTIIANVLKWGTGAINIDGCRVPHVTIAGGNLAQNSHLRKTINGGNGGKIISTEKERRVVIPNNEGRYPANVIHDGSDEVEAAFLQFGIKSSGKPGIRRKEHTTNSMSGTLNVTGNLEAGPGDSGSVSRFFYCAKVSTKDRAGSKHPTIKPMSLMQYLVRLVTPPNGKVCDPFLGSGTTAIACELEGFNCVGIELNKDSYDEYFVRRSHFIKSKQSFHFSPTRNKKRRRK